MDAHHLARIRYVTRHFESLKGLSWMGVAMPSLLLVWTAPLIDPHPLVGRIQWVTAVFPVFFLSGWLGHRASGYYAKRFGDLKDENRLDRILPWALLFAGALLADHWRLASGGVSATLAVAALLGLWRVARGRPWRAHQLLLAIVAGIAAFALPLPGPGEPQVRYVLLVSTLLLVTSSFCAWLDHRLLVKSLRPHPAVPFEADEHALAPEGQS